MLLAIDIGNSKTKFAVFDGETIVNKFTIQTIRDQTSDSIYSKIEKHISQQISSIVISTVVKELKETYHKLGEQHLKTKPFFADHTFDYGFEVKYYPPENCGSDRLVDAFAAVEIYGKPLIVCDFGTATTIDVVNSKNEYLGGIITPGPNTLGSALFEKTSKLPKVEFEKPENVIGNSTVSSIQAGIYFGYIGLVDGIIERMLDTLGEKSKIISTGGFAELISEESKYVEIVEKNLMLDGLRLIHDKINGD